MENNLRGSIRQLDELPKGGTDDKESNRDLPPQALLSRTTRLPWRLSKAFAR
jgi:hypothetical protein